MKTERCETCNKPAEPWRTDGCSHTDCPHRKRLTAVPPGYHDGVVSDRVWLSPSTKARDE